MAMSKNKDRDRIQDIIEPAPIDLSVFTVARRESTRPPHLREPGFEREFDDTTLFYDAFRPRVE